MVKRGDIYFADLSPVIGSEQGGIRPVLVIKIILATISVNDHHCSDHGEMAKPKLPTHIGIKSNGTRN